MGSERKGSMMNTFASVKRKPVKEESKPWLPDELDYNIKHFNELFIENLS